MPIIFGFRTRRAAIGVMMRACSQCGRVTPQTIIVTKRYFTLFFIPVIPFPHSYKARCNVCSQVTKVPRNALAEVKAALASGQAQATAAAVQQANLAQASRPPAGWYTDPQNPAGQRWWDGKVWGPSKEEVNAPSAIPAASSQLPAIPAAGTGDSGSTADPPSGLHQGDQAELPSDN